jgi:hypothetical protein
VPYDVSFKSHRHGPYTKFPILPDRRKGKSTPHLRYHKAQDAAVLPMITALMAARSTYGYHRITAVLNRQLRGQGLAPVNHKRVYRIMQAHSRRGNTPSDPITLMMVR